MPNNYYHDTSHRKKFYGRFNVHGLVIFMDLYKLLELPVSRIGRKMNLTYKTKRKRKREREQKTLKH